MIVKRKGFVFSSRCVVGFSSLPNSDHVIIPWSCCERTFGVVALMWRVLVPCPRCQHGIDVEIHFEPAVMSHTAPIATSVKSHLVCVC